MRPDWLEIVPDDVPQRDLVAESNLRAHRAGLPVTRAGQPKPRAIQAIVGWGARKYNLWPRDELGRLIDD